MPRTHVSASFDSAPVLFADRAEAGRALVSWIAPDGDPTALVFALPRGGIPVARPFADALGCPLLPVFVRKLPIPSSPEMGFGAVTIDGTVRLNREVIEAFRIRDSEVTRVVAEVRAELERRSTAYAGGWPLPPVEGRDVWLVDDGLATGLSMLTAADMIRAHAPASVSIAVPCSPTRTLDRVAPEVDATWCLAAQRLGPFAVAAFYADFHDLSDDEVRAVLSASKDDRAS
jgi:putative phosphoribosyl transferase